VPPTIKEVAERAGVSPGTVSNTLNRPERVNPRTRSRVLAAIEELGFIRNGSARDLRVGRSRTVGLVVLDVGNPFFTDVARGVDEVVAANGSVLTLVDLANDVERQRRHLDNLEEQRVQGVLITPVDDEDPRLDELVARGVPVVLLDRRSADGRRCSVAVDDVLGGRLAAEHLVERGHRRLAFVGGPHRIRQVADRLQGASAVLAAAGVEPLRVVERPGLTLDDGQRAGEELAALDAASRPTAVFCANELLALGVLQALTTAGLRIPDDVAIVGYDDIAYAAAAAVPLSSVHQPRKALGETAARLLFEEIRAEGNHHHRQVVFQPELVIRASSDFRRG
jgi:LacI family transcriptional regulator, galactose operon repressor